MLVATQWSRPHSFIKERVVMFNRYRYNACIFIIVLFVSANGASAQNAWTLVGIGDTQVLVQSSAGGDVFKTNSQWIVDNAVRENIVFVTQLGDIVQNGLYGRTDAAAPSLNNEEEWTRAKTAMSILEDGKVGWGISVGNHELDWVEVLPGVTPTSAWWSAANPSTPVPSSGFNKWKRNFGPITMRRLDFLLHFGGASADDINSYFIYNAGGRDYLHMHLEIDIPDSVMAWAQQIIDDNPGMPTIISTHVFEGTQHGPPNNPFFGGRNSANDIWDKLISSNDQIFLVLSGHTGEQIHQIRINEQGNKVFTIVQDYAAFDANNVNSGWIRLYKFDELNGLIRVNTYFPTLDEFMTFPEHQFDLTLDWSTRF